MYIHVPKSGTNGIWHSILKTMLLSEAWPEEFQLCIIRKHINHNSWNIYDNSYTPHNLLAAFHCFRVLFYSGTHCILIYCFFLVYTGLSIKSGTGKLRELLIDAPLTVDQLRLQTNNVNNILGITMVTPWPEHQVSSGLLLFSPWTIKLCLVDGACFIYLYLNLWIHEFVTV